MDRCQCDIIFDTRVTESGLGGASVCVSVVPWEVLRARKAQGGRSFLNALFWNLEADGFGDEMIGLG